MRVCGGCARGEGMLSDGGAAAPKLSVALGANKQITIEWSRRGTLQTAASVGGPWADVPSALSPFTMTTAGVAFYRVVVK